MACMDVLEFERSCLSVFANYLNSRKNGKKLTFAKMLQS